MNNVAGIFLVFVVGGKTVACSCSGEAHATGKIFQLARTGVAGQDDDRVAEIHCPAVAVGKASVVEHLKQHIEHIAVGFLYFIEQNDGVGMASHLLCQLSSLSVSYISRRCTYKARNGVLLGVFAHIDTYECILRAKHKLGELFGEECLSYTSRTEEHEHTDGMVGVFQSHTVALNCLHHLVDSLVLSHHGALEF